MATTVGWGWLGRTGRFEVGRLRQDTRAHVTELARRVGAEVPSRLHGPLASRLLIAGLLVIACGVGVALFVDDPVVQRFGSVAASVATVGELLSTAWSLHRWGRERAPDSDPVEELAERVRENEDSALRVLLGGIRVAPVSFRAPTGPRRGWLRGVVRRLLGGLSVRRYDQSAVGRLSLAFRQVTGSTAEGSYDIGSVGQFFADSSSRRLVVLGEPGAGKTVLAMMLVYQLLSRRAQGADLLDGLVPVRFDIAAWHPDVALADWMAEQLNVDYGVPAVTARELVKERSIIPVLDGLDEMGPSDERPTSGVRARKALDALNEYGRTGEPAPLVLTCRTSDYEHLTKDAAGLLDATVVRLERLERTQIQQHIDDRFGANSPQANRWRPLLDRPDVVNALSTPWRLMLATTLPVDGKPVADRVREGADSSRPSLDRILLGHYVAATRSVLAKRGGYDPAQVEGWLRRLACWLQEEPFTIGVRAPAGLSAVDLVPHLLWPIGGIRRVRLVHAVAAGLLSMGGIWVWFNPMDIFSAGSGLVSALEAGETGRAITNYWTLIFFLLILILPTAVVMRRCSRPWPIPKVQLYRRKIKLADVITDGKKGYKSGLERAGYRGAWIGIVIGAVNAAALFIGGEQVLTESQRRRIPDPLLWPESADELFSWPGSVVLGVSTLVFWVVLGALIWPVILGSVDAIRIVFGYGSATWRPDAAVTSPQAAIWFDLKIGLTTGVTAAAAVAMPFFILVVFDRFVGIEFSGASWPAALWLAIPFTFGVAYQAVAWGRYLSGVLVTGFRGQLPMRLGHFLDWSCEAGLLRISGSSYQFRHRELRDWLADDSTRTSTDLNSKKAVSNSFWLPR